MIEATLRILCGVLRVQAPGQPVDLRAEHAA
jgi:hypothetical protein